MFKDLKWQEALKRAAIFTIIWLALVYVINQISPGSFGASGRDGIIAIAAYAAVFFVLYTIVFAFIERRKGRLRAESRGKSRASGKDARPGEENGASGTSLKGQRNPNTSRKKAARRRR